MLQRYHVVFKKGEKITTRRPWKGPDVEKYSSSGMPDKGIPAMFGDHEKRQFLEGLGPFTMITVDNKQPDIAMQILREGYVVTDPDTQVQSQWYVAGYYVRDDGVVYIMTPKPTTDTEFFKTLGLRIDLENEWGNSFKVGKYMKRLFSHHRKFMQGTVIHEAGDVIQVRLNNGRTLSVRYADYGKLTDGMNLVSTRCMKMMGLKRTKGAGLRVTALSPKGFSKGHAIVLPHLQHDLVLFNSKKLLFGDTFTFGMEWLHDGGAVFTDVQSYVNFRFVQDRNLLTWSKMYMETVIDAIEDTEKLRKMLQFYHIETHMEPDEDGDLRFINKEKDWTLLNALRHGVDIQQHPALVRRYFNLFTKTVMNCESNLRVPINIEVGGARYAMVDPGIFDMWGDPTLEGELRGNTVYCDGKLGEVAFHRQPNGHRNEHHIAKAVDSEYLKSMDTGCFMFLGRDMVVESLGKLGGGDQDDRLVYYTDQKVVDHFKELELDPYPIEAVQELPKPIRKINAFEHRRLRTPRYDRDQLLVMLDQMKEQGISIGYVVNALMQDTCITDHKEELLAFGKSHLPKTLKNEAAIAWIETYPGNVLRGPASRLEVVIDAVKKTGADLRKDIGEPVRNYNATYLAVPEFFTRGGKFDGRIPQSRRNAGAPVPMRCAIDYEIEEVQQLRADLEDIITNNCYQMMKPLPEEILTYPTIPVYAKQLALAIKQNYHNQWANLKNEEPNEAYQKIDKALYSQYHTHPLIMDAMVELYIIVMGKRKPEAPINEDGTLKKYPDGILWGTYMSGLTIKMLELVGLAGRYVPIQWEPGAQHNRHQELKAIVENGVVRQEGTNTLLGTLNPSPYPDGQVTIEKGLVKVQAKDAYPYEGPAPKWMVLSVVNGWGSKEHTPEDLDIWHQQADREVELVPYIYVNDKQEEEHAVRVMLDGQEYGHISRRDACYVIQNKRGWLALGNGPQTMSVITEEVKR